MKDRALVGITATEEYHQQRREIGHHLGDIPRIGNGELTVEFRQPFDLIAFGTAELKQKKAAGVGSDDLHQFKYTPEVFQTHCKTVAKASSVTSGDLLGVLQRTQQAELLELWANLSKDQQKLVLELARDLYSTDW